MHRVPKKFRDRVVKSLKGYQKIAKHLQRADAAEADTVTLVTDVLADMFGYDKFEDITGQLQIKGTYCDLAIKIGNQVKLLIEVKSAGTALNEGHLRQAIHYGADHGIHWIVLTNGLEWRLMHLTVANQVMSEEVVRFDLTEVNPRSDDDIQFLFLLAKEGLATDAMDAFHQHSQILNKYTVSAILRSDPVVGTIRREMRRLFPDLKITTEAISDLLANDLVKRETLEGDKADEAVKRVKKSFRKIERQKAKKALAD